MVEEHDVPYRFRGLELPEELRQSLIRYAEDGVPTGDFLRAALSNDLQETVGRADDVNIHLIPVVVAFMYNVLPGNCWGSPEAYRRHIEAMRKVA